MASALMGFGPLRADAARRLAPKKPPARQPSSDATLTQILTLENQRNTTSALVSALKNPQASIRRAAILALGRIGDPSVLGDLSEELNRRRASDKALVAFALGIMPDETALTMAIQHLAMQQDPDVLAELYVAIGRGGGEKQVALFDGALKNAAHPRVLSGVCRGLGLLWSKDSETWAVPPELIANLLLRVKQAETLAPACAFALSRFKGQATHIPPAELVATAQKTGSRESELLLLKTLARVHQPAALGLLVQKAASFVPAPLRTEALKALASHPINRTALTAAQSALAGPQSSVIYAALELLQSYGPEAKDAAPAVLVVYQTSSSPWLRGKALSAGMAADAALFRAAVLKEITDPKASVRADAARALSSHAEEGDLALVATLIADPDRRVAAATIDGLLGWPEARFTEPVRNALRAALSTKDPAVVSAVAAVVQSFKWKDFGAPLVTIYPGIEKPELFETRIAVIGALNALADSKYVPLFEGALKDPDRQVITAAVAALKSSASRDESARIPINSKPAAYPFSLPEVRTATTAHVEIKTSRGEIELRFMPDTPLTAVQFLRLVRQRFYDGLEFHRVVPGFVVQGGDPRGDGFGGPGYLVRDEVTPRSHTAGTVGWATGGKDTGGSQFFINLGPNYHLDGKYTLFAEVTRGLDVAEKLEPGDKILSARILP